MINNIVKIISTTTLPTADGKKTYLSVTWKHGGKEFKKPIFDPALQKVFQQAEKSGESVNVGVEKEGNYWNVKSAEITSEEVTQAEPKTIGGSKKSYGKSQDEEDWTNIRTAVMQAVAARPAQDKPNIKGIMNDANEMFADMCVMKPNRSKDAS